MTADDLFVAPGEFVGQPVAVADVATEVLDDDAYLLAPPKQSDAADVTIPVIGERRGADVDAGNDVLATGTVVTIVEASFQEDFGVPFGPAFAPFIGQPAIAAESTDVLTNEAMENPAGAIGQDVVVAGWVTELLTQDVFRIHRPGFAIRCCSCSARTPG